jgi:hypothetical protein
MIKSQRAVLFLMLGAIVFGAASQMSSSAEASSVRSRQEQTQRRKKKKKQPVARAVSSAVMGDAVAQEILTAHNKYRREVGVPDLVWSEDLARDAQKWSDRLASMGGNQLVHAEGTDQGENLWLGTSGYFSATDMVKGWGDEKQYFRPGKFPEVSTTGNWTDVGHYTQVVWRDTREVGCAKSTAGGNDILTCRYRNPGNYMGQKPF